MIEKKILTGQLSISLNISNITRCPSVFLLSSFMCVITSLIADRAFSNAEWSWLLLLVCFNISISKSIEIRNNYIAIRNVSFHEYKTSHTNASLEDLFEINLPFNKRLILGNRCTGLMRRSWRDCRPHSGLVWQTLRKAWNRGLFKSHCISISFIASKKLTKGGYAFSRSWEYFKRILPAQ